MPASSAIEVDGQLNEPAWANAPRHAGFVERKPALRGVPKDQTWFAVVYTRSYLYIGVFCHDRDPSKVRARTTARDTFAVFSDDAISVKLDVAMDKRTTIGFVLNPAGARLDYRGINEQKMRREFDTRWHGAAAKNQRGWSAEFQIPWSSLAIDPSKPPAKIGLNFSRDHSHRNATYDWALMPPPFTPISASLYGELSGFEQLPSLPGGVTATQSAGQVEDKPWNFVPWVLGGVRKDSQGATPSPLELPYSGGLDVNLRVGPSARMQLTLNTDFSQVNVDDQVVNLGRFSLFMPEKREFFLRDFEIFSFGRAGVSQLFHSRRIGLVNGQPIPILAGVKTVAELGSSVRVGLLNVVTRSVDATSSTPSVPWTNHSVARALWEAKDGSNLGAMWTRRQTLSLTDDFNDVLGVDGAFRGAGTPWLVTGFAVLGRTGEQAGASLTDVGGVASVDSEAGQRRAGAAVTAMYRGLLWRPRLEYSWFDRGFRADTGFFRRVGVHDATASLAYEPRFQKYGLEKLNVMVASNGVFEARGERLLDTSSGLGAQLNWNSGFRVGANLTYSTVTVQQPFTVGTETSIPEGGYDMWIAEVSGATPWVRSAAVSTTFRLRDYFGGQMFYSQASVVLRPGGFLRVEAGGSLSRAWFNGVRPDFWAAVVNARAAVGFTPDLNLDVFVGWNRIAGRIPVNMRLRWTWRQNSDIFVVWQGIFSDSNEGSLFHSVLAKWMWSLP